VYRLVTAVVDHQGSHAVTGGSPVMAVVRDQDLRRPFAVPGQRVPIVLVQSGGLRAEEKSNRLPKLTEDQEVLTFLHSHDSRTGSLRMASSARSRGWHGVVGEHDDHRVGTVHTTGWTGTGEITTVPPDRGP
jgi:hypothetical protein